MGVADKNYWCVKLVDLKKLEAPLIKKEVFFMDKIITISRQYGSGGREIGKRLADFYNIPFYDNEIITRAAKESGFAEAAFANAESKASNSLLYSIAMGMNSYGNQELGFSHL